MIFVLVSLWVWGNWPINIHIRNFRFLVFIFPVPPSPEHAVVVNFCGKNKMKFILVEIDLHGRIFVVAFLTETQPLLLLETC